MGDVVAAIKVMPDSPEIDLDDLQNRLEDTLPEGAEISDVNTDDVAFGLTALIPTVIVPDEEGGTEAVEEAFSEVEDVESVSVEDVGRL
ncbi:elongation factor 1-beta [Halovenus aranensis]|jgi:elongation factor 1-beta|uniref:Elongation factor 1-beta n=1 Tax=Halovenus aranensis TaxID=890420 RepID=A0A1G8RZI8_9EURY|nr:elongation factor 1-beta [Halovenus aranensis]SDJ22388.1 elongation factor 1-beta [Halovenus aranensis]